jgi:hypothetical protein
MTTAPTPSPATDAPAGLTFVDPDQSAQAFRVVLWAAPGEGKTVAAASAPGPILAVSADRPRAWQYARRKYPDKTIHEARFESYQTLRDVYTYLKAGSDVRTVVLDPWQTIYNKIVDQTPLRGGEVDYQGVNKTVLGFLHSLRQFDVNVIIVAHERLSEGKRGDGRLYPQLGGPSLINEILKEADVVAHVEREPGTEEHPDRWVAQLQPRDNLVCKDSLGLGERREIDLTAWFREAHEAERGPATDLPPWDPEFEPETENAPAAAEPARDAALSAEFLLDEIKGQKILAGELRDLLASVNAPAPTGLKSRDETIAYLDGLPDGTRMALANALVLRARDRGLSTAKAHGLTVVDGGAPAAPDPVPAGA